MIGRYSVRSPPCPFAKLMAVWTDQRESVEVVTGLAAKTASRSEKSVSERIGTPKRIRMVGARQIEKSNPATDSAEDLSFMALLLTVGAIPFDTPLRVWPPSPMASYLKLGQTRTRSV